jgi:hypothetical protein
MFETHSQHFSTESSWSRETHLKIDLLPGCHFGEFLYIVLRMWIKNKTPKSAKKHLIRWLIEYIREMCVWSYFVTGIIPKYVTLPRFKAESKKQPSNPLLVYVRPSATFRHFLLYNCQKVAEVD